MSQKQKSTHHGSGVNAAFAHFAQAVAAWSGHSIAFLLAVLVIVVWVVTGPMFDYSDTWQLVINTGTTIITFLMVFLIQNTQNRDMMAVQLKLSELVLAMKGAENKFAAIEDLTDEELRELHEDCKARVEMTSDHINSRQEHAKKEKAKPASSTRHAAHRSKQHTRRSHTAH